MSNIKTANLNVKLKDLFFRWLDITKAFHKLNNQQQKVLALFLYYHYLYRKDITNNKILWKIVFDYDTKMKIKEDAVFDEGLSDNALNNVLTILRKKKIIVNGQIAPLFIPDLDIKSKQFRIVFNFNIVDNG